MGKQALAVPTTQPTLLSRAPRQRAAVPLVSADRAASFVVLGGIAAGAVAAVWLWWHDTGYLHGFGDWLTNAGRVTGLLAGYGVVVLLFLMSRVPYLEHRVGTDRLARWHAMGGRYTVCLVVAHATLIVWGYAVTDHTSVTHQTVTLWTSYPDVLMATVALLLLVGVGVASARAARRRLSYETWHFVHLYTYLAVALAFSHQFANGAEFIGPSGRPARVYWIALYVVVAATLVWHRVVTPIRGLFRRRLRVIGVWPESADTLSVVVAGRHVDELGIAPGQFFRWRFLTRGLWWAANPYSLSAVPRGDQLRITVKATGRHSAALRMLRPGTAVLAEGPYGSFTAVRRRRERVLLIGAGVGITPLRALFESLPGAPGDVTLIYRASTPEDLVLHNELDGIAAWRSARVHYVVGPRRAGRADPLAPDRIMRLVPDVRERDVFICGPDSLAASMRTGLRRLGVPGGQIHHESFSF